MIYKINAPGVIHTNDHFDTDEDDFEGELVRFRMIIHMHEKARGASRRSLREVCVSYLKFSPQADRLINELILECTKLKSPDRLDLAIDILQELGDALYDYAFKFFQCDVTQWNYLLPGRTYEPDDDYWYILLRSVARSSIDDSKKLSFVWSCRETSHRGVLEGLVEALGDIGSAAAMEKLGILSRHEDNFIAQLAHEVLKDQ